MEKNRLFEIAVELGNILDERHKLQKLQEDVYLHIEQCKTSLIPPNGWPGSNADTRKAAEKLAEANNPELSTLENSKNALQEAMDDFSVYRDELLNEREAYTWTIRDNEVVANGGKSVFSEEE